MVTKGIGSPSSPESFLTMIGARLRAAREELNLNQEEVSSLVGFKDRQILSNVESGKRKVTAQELLSFMNVLKQPLEFFTDPFLLVGEAAFSWRANPNTVSFKSFEQKAARWISLYRKLSNDLGEHTSPLMSQLVLTKQSSYEQAQECAEKLVLEWGLGEIPSRKLPEVIESKLDVLVLYVDPDEGISGAACHLPELCTILVNRAEQEGRRSYNLAHELFHVLTWDRMPPETVEPSTETESSKNRVEQLANNFATALLMPRTTIEKLFKSRKPDAELSRWIQETATHLGVSSAALFWRLKSLSLLTDEQGAWVNLGLSAKKPKETDRNETPPLFSKKFVSVLHQALSNGLISVSRVESLLGLDRETHEHLYLSYGLGVPFDL